MRRLIALYPKAWRDRYGEELTELAHDRSRLGRLATAVDLVRGAFDAHLQRLDPAVRRGAADGAVVAAMAALVLFLSNVVFPAGPDESDNDPEYLVQIFGAYLLLTVLFVAIGARARREADRRYRGGGQVDWAGAKAGAAAGLVLGVAVLVTALVIDNAFFSIVSQQHDKRMAFARSGWSSMRAFVNFQVLGGALVVLPAGTFVGGALGAVGGLLARAGRRRRKPYLPPVPSVEKSHMP
jgi:hypothetical protein